MKITFDLDAEPAVLTVAGRETSSKALTPTELSAVARAFTTLFAEINFPLRGGVVASSSAQPSPVGQLLLLKLQDHEKTSNFNASVYGSGKATFHRFFTLLLIGALKHFDPVVGAQVMEIFERNWTDAVVEPSPLSTHAPQA